MTPFPDEASVDTTELEISSDEEPLIELPVEGSRSLQPPRPLQPEPGRRDAPERSAVPHLRHEVQPELDSSTGRHSHSRSPVLPVARPPPPPPPSSRRCRWLLNDVLRSLPREEPDPCMGISAYQLWHSLDDLRQDGWASHDLPCGVLWQYECRQLDIVLSSMAMFLRHTSMFYFGASRCPESHWVMISDGSRWIIRGPALGRHCDLYQRFVVLWRGPSADVADAEAR